MLDFNLVNDIFFPSEPAVRREKKFPFKKKIKSNGAKFHLVQTLLRPVRVLKHMAESTPTALLIEWLY